MPRIVTSLSEISSRYDALFCDLWGCVHNGRTAYPAALAALFAYRNQGGTVVLLTNAPRPAPAVIPGFSRLGIPPGAYDFVVSSGDAAQAAMFSGAVGRRVYHLGPAKDESFFTPVPAEFAAADPIVRVPLAEATGIVCTGPFNEATEVPDDYRASFLLAKTKGLQLLCTNPDLVVDLGDKRIYCAGALAELYTAMGGTSLYFGKPHPPIYDLARARIAPLGIEDDRILCVGDGIATDIAGGLAEGFDTLFITGGLAADEFGHDVEAPDPGLLQSWLDRRSLSPTAAIGRLR